jgi:hypothetical protein
MSDIHHPGRRSLLAAGAASTAALGASWLLTGCTGAAAAPVLPAAAKKGAPDRGGTLRVARPPASEAETLDPASALSAYEYLGALYNRLVRVDADLDWLSFVGKLRLTGMPIADMVRFAELVRRGEVTFDERREILEQTRREVVARIAELQDTVAVLDSKIDFFAGARRASERD